MWKFLTAAISFMAIAMLFNSCGEDKPEPVGIDSLATYSDNYYQYSIKYPANWYKIEQADRFLAYSDTLAIRRFQDYNVEGFPGARVMVRVQELDTAATMQKVLDTYGQTFKKDFMTETDTTLNDIPTKKYTYEFERLDGFFKGEMYIATKDSSVATIVNVESFANAFDDLYRNDFDKIISSVKFAQKPEKKADTVYKEVEADPPSSNLISKSGQGFTIGIPENFARETDPYKPESAEKSYLYMGKRRGDSYLKVEIFDASKSQNLKKIVDENKGSFGNATPEKTTLGGEEAYVLNYKPQPKVAGKVYFAIHKKKLYRVFMTWYTPESSDYRSPFQKAIKSMKFN